MNNNDLPIAGSKSRETTDKARQWLNNVSGALAANSWELRNGIPRRTDIVFACIFALGGGILGTIVFQWSGYAYFYQFFSPETVYWACGQGWVRPAEIPPALLAFLTFQTQSFDCSALPAGVHLFPAGLFTQVELYLMATIAALWRATSVSYSNLWPLAAAMVGSYTAGCYALLRLFFPRLSSVIGGLILTLSPAALNMVPFIRDYSKAPFFIWSLVLLIAAARQQRWRTALLCAAAAGAVVGTGYGFRTDQIILVPLGIVLLIGDIGPRRFLSRAVAAVAFLVFFIACASPVLFIGNLGGMGAMVMEGASDPFNKYLGLTSGPASLGATYSDELTLSSIAADLRPGEPQWDAQEPEAAYGLSQSLTDSTAYVAQRFRFFSGDMATRALKSAAWILGFPSAMNWQRLTQDPGGEANANASVNHYLGGPYELIGGSWLPPLGIVGILAFFLRLSARRVSESIALAIVFGILLGYTGIQFSSRHVFHLEFFWILALLALVHAALEFKRLVPILPLFLTAAVVLSGVIGVTYFGLVELQDASLHGEVRSLLSGPRQDLPLAPNSRSSVASFAIPVPDKYKALIAGPPDSMFGKALPVGVQWNVRAAVDRLVLTLGGAKCPSDSFDVRLNYDKRNAWQPFDRTLVVKASQDQSRPTRIVIPAYYRPTQNLASIELPLVNAGCLLAIQKLDQPTLLPAVFSAILDPDWETRPMTLGFGNFDFPGHQASN